MTVNLDSIYNLQAITQSFFQAMSSKFNMAVDLDNISIFKLLYPNIPIMMPKAHINPCGTTRFSWPYSGLKF
jgi:hypothetical protein